MSANARPIILMGEEMPACPECGGRLAVSERPVAHYADGLLFAGVCATHGTWRLQDDPDDTSDEDEADDG